MSEHPQPKKEIGRIANEATIQEAAERFNLPTLQELAAEEEPGDRECSGGWKDECKHQHCAEGGRHD